MFFLLKNIAVSEYVWHETYSQQKLCEKRTQYICSTFIDKIYMLSQQKIDISNDAFNGNGTLNTPKVAALDNALQIEKQEGYMVLYYLLASGGEQF